MKLFKEFIAGQREIELAESFIILAENINPKLYVYITELLSIKFVDGEYHKYCGEIKLLVNNFVNYWTDVINDCVKEADTFTYNITTKNQLLELIEKTIKTQYFKQDMFEKSFLPIENKEEQKRFEEVAECCRVNLKGLAALKEKVGKFDRPEMIDECLKSQFEISIRKKNDAFVYAHKSFALQLAKQTPRIRTSFEEILLRLRNNLKKLKEQDDLQLHKLLQELYDENKERLQVSRQQFHRTTETAEVEYAIKKIREKIEMREVKMPIVRLEEEVNYWERRLAEFSAIEKTIIKLQAEIDNMVEYQKQYEEMKTIELPGSKKTCFEKMGENFKRRREYAENTLMEISQTLMTFFAIRGKNHIFYKDNIGFYTLDEYGHQVYLFDNNRKGYHVACSGQLKQVQETDKYYYDVHGRYIIGENGEKVYQWAACTSTYNLGDDELLTKTTKDCGHSEIPNPKCRMQQRNINNIELLPTTEPADIQRTLTPLVSKYLWDNVAYVLAEALRDTGQKRSNNPIYYLAHRLIHHKYIKNSLPVVLQKRKEADLYRTNILKRRFEVIVETSKAWSAKQVQPRKPEEFDDTETRAVYQDYAAKQQLAYDITYGSYGYD